MAEERAQRRLAAILAADVVGYSRLMGEDEAGTLTRLKELRATLVDPVVAEHRGRIVKLMGDGALVEFASVVDAVQCAVEIQCAMAERNAEVPEDRRIEFRVGINLGDVIVEGEDIYGDGVNVAARLEGLAEPGGVCVAGTVFDHVKGKLDLPFDDMGSQTVKNIAAPVRAYRWRSGPVTAAISVVPEMTAKTSRDPYLPNKPSIAVLPFDNMSGDPEQEYFADGLAEDIITTLSKLSNLFVISRNSTFAYKGKATDVRKIAEDLGVGSVLEGSVRKAGDRVRITGQLIDAKTGNHLWAEKYDRQLADIFDLQDEITREIVTALSVRLTEGDQIQLRRRQTNSVEAWESYCRGQSYLRRFNKPDNEQAKQTLNQVITTDPKFASAWSHLAWAHYMDARGGWAPSDEAFERATEYAKKSLSIDDRLPDAYAMLGAIALHRRNYAEAASLGEKAIELGPSIADNMVILGMTMNYSGHVNEGLELVERAMRLSPHYPDWYLGIVGVSYFQLGRYEDAIAADEARLERNPDNIFSDFRLAAIYQKLGREEKAKTHAAQALKKNPSLSLSQIEISEPYQDPEILQDYLELLRRAGVPE
jgi:adenylate cyclase